MSGTSWTSGIRREEWDIWAEGNNILNLQTDGTLSYNSDEGIWIGDTVGIYGDHDGDPIFNINKDRLHIIPRVKYPFLIQYPGHDKGFSRELNNIRRYLLLTLGETRSTLETYKKYLMISLTSKEVFELFNTSNKYLIKKHIPKWAIEEIKRGQEVECFIQVKPQKPWYIKYEDSSVVSKLPYGFNMRSNNGLDANYSFIINGEVMAKFNITNIIKTEICESGKYDKNLFKIIEKTALNLKDLEKIGRIKPIYYLDVSDLILINRRLHQSIFMLDFSVEGKILEPKKLFKEFKSIGTVWF